MNPQPSPNFAYLAYHDARLVALATQAEQHFASDPIVTLFKLRQFGEVLAQRAAAKVGLFIDPLEGQQQLIERLYNGGAIGVTQRTLFHDLRRVGNAAVHEGKGDHREALHQLRMARELAVWFQRSFGNNKKFDPGPFVPPQEPKRADPTLQEELERLRRESDERLAAEQQKTERMRQTAEAAAAERLTAEQRAAKAEEDAAIWEALAKDEIEAHQRVAQSHAQRNAALEQQNQKLLAELAAAQAAAAAQPARERAETLRKAKQASDAIELDEAATRKLIDRQLRDAGWEVDSETLTFEKGVRPMRGKNLAIAEWPTRAKGKEGWADYVLFAGLTVVGVVEAKRKYTDIPAVIEQAKRYSEGYLIQGDESLPEGSPWDGVYKVPFLFATNGRAYIRQLRTKSGIWFLDARRSKNNSKDLPAWPSPDDLLDRLKQDVDSADAQLKVEPMPFIDREYQRKAIRAVEQGLADGRTEMLLAMATGTGKTRTCIGLCYRLLKTKRCRRILFLVDRTALGTQTADALKELRIENQQTFTDIYDVKALDDLKIERETKLHIATIQAMVKRVLGGGDEAEPAGAPTVGQYDCIIVDECHRGYLLDRELSDQQFLFRDEDDYISQYRRVLDYFDAVKVGLTATPALHTKEIFGSPIYTYSYREAVVDGFLIDHEPPIRIVTELAEDGIHYHAREEVLVLDRGKQTLNKEELPDEVQFDVDSFNRRVIAENFDRAVLNELAKFIDPALDEKTLIFCVTDEHADMVVMHLKEAFADRYGGVDDDAVLKITGKADRPLEKIRRFRNERNPNVVVTVDLLTTGVDIPKIANLVFLRRVRSRILYEQMLGRATRLCDEIKKERFRIFDAVDLYSSLQQVTDMKPVVVNPSVSFEQLAKEIVEARDEDQRRTAIDEFMAKLQRKKRALKDEAAESFEAAAGMDAPALLQFLKKCEGPEAAEFFKAHGKVASFLDRTSAADAQKLVVSDRTDQVRYVRRGYGKAGNHRPRDYLDAFRDFIQGNLNRIPALLVITQRPRDLTREDLRTLRLMLDREGYNEQYLRAAWREETNEDIAASIIGYIRKLALGSPLVPYDDRVDHALRRLRKAHQFTENQNKWLERIARQLKHELVVDRAALDSDLFKKDGGGFSRLNKIFDGTLEAVLGELSDEIWKDAG